MNEEGNSTATSVKTQEIGKDEAEKLINQIYTKNSKRKHDGKIT